MGSTLHQLLTGMVRAMPIVAIVLCRMLNSLTVQELKNVHGLVALQLPWVVVELAIHALLIRRLTNHMGIVDDLSCVEFFAGSDSSSQIAKSFSELGLGAMAFDINRFLSSLRHVFCSL